MYVKNSTETHQLGVALGRALVGGDCLELVGDVGAGKTTLTQAIAQGMGVDVPVQSPTFTIQREYQARDGLRLVHYDFYRLSDAGIMENELMETAHDPQTVTVVEWADTVESVLPNRRVIVTIVGDEASESARNITYRLEGIWNDPERISDVFTS